MAASPRFTVEFASVKAQQAFEQSVDLGVVALHAVTLSAAVATGDEVKQRLRTYFDGVFANSDPTRNNHRRASNAMVRSRVYDELESKGQYTYLIYSRLGRGMGPGSFVDYLLLHLTGGSVVPRTRNWLRLAVSDDARRLQAKGGFVPTGSSPAAGTQVFFAPAKNDPNKLFQLRRNTRTGQTQLLAVLLKSVRIAPRLGGLDAVLQGADAAFDKNFDVAWRRESAKAGLS